MLRKISLFSFILLLAVSMVGVGAGFGAQKFDRKFLKMVSGTSGGSWYPIAAGIMKVVQEETGISTSSGPGGGVGNMYAIQKGTADIAFGYAHTITNAYKGKGVFKQHQNKLRYVATLYPSTFQTAVLKNSDITSYSQIKNKRVTPGKIDFTSTEIAIPVLQAYGMTFKSIKESGGNVSYVGFSDAAALMKDGHLDVGMFLTECPAAVLMELNFSPGIRFLGIDAQHMKKVLELEPGLIESKIPKTAYKDMTEDVPTVGTATCVVIRDDIEDDVVYAITNALWKRLNDLIQIKKIMEEAKLENA